MKTKRPERIRLGSISVIILMVYDRFLLVVAPFHIVLFSSIRFWFSSPSFTFLMISAKLLALPQQQRKKNAILKWYLQLHVSPFPFEWQYNRILFLAIFLCMCVNSTKINASAEVFRLFWQSHFDFSNTNLLRNRQAKQYRKRKLEEKEKNQSSHTGLIELK